MRSYIAMCPKKYFLTRSLVHHNYITAQFWVLWKKHTQHSSYIKLILPTIRSTWFFVPSSSSRPLLLEDWLLSWQFLLLMITLLTFSAIKCVFLRFVYLVFFSVLLAVASLLSLFPLFLPLYLSQYLPLLLILFKKPRISVCRPTFRKVGVYLSHLCSLSTTPVWKSDL